MSADLVLGLDPDLYVCAIKQTPYTRRSSLEDVEPFITELLDDPVGRSFGAYLAISLFGVVRADLIYENLLEVIKTHVVAAPFHTTRPSAIRRRP